MARVCRGFVPVFIGILNLHSDSQLQLKFAFANLNLSSAIFLTTQWGA